MHEQYFKPPFSFPYGKSKVFTSDFQMAFDFVSKILEPNAVSVSDEHKDTLLAILNGSSTLKPANLKLSYASGTMLVVL